MRLGELSIFSKPFHVRIKIDSDFRHHAIYAKNQNRYHRDRLGPNADKADLRKKVRILQIPSPPPVLVRTSKRGQISMTPSWLPCAAETRSNAIDYPLRTRTYVCSGDRIRCASFFEASLARSRASNTICAIIDLSTGIPRRCHRLPQPSFTHPSSPPLNWQVPCLKMRKTNNTTLQEGNSATHGSPARTAASSNSSLPCCGRSELTGLP